MEDEIYQTLSAQCPAELFEGITEKPDTETRQDAHTRVAKFMTMKAVGIPGTPERMVKLATGDHEGTFMAAVTKAWNGSHRSNDGLERGDIEIEADALGVYEDIWPFDPEKLAELPDTLEMEFYT